MSSIFFWNLAFGFCEKSVCIFSIKWYCIPFNFIGIMYYVIQLLLVVLVFRFPPNPQKCKYENYRQPITIAVSQWLLLTHTKKNDHQTLIITPYWRETSFNFDAWTVKEKKKKVRASLGFVVAHRSVLTKSFTVTRVACQYIYCVHTYIIPYVVVV